MIPSDDILYLQQIAHLHNDTRPAKHVLVADDNHANRLIAKTILERDNYKVTLARNGLEAVEAVETAKNQTYDIILMDILMPVMGGIKALRRIKDLAPAIKTPPIFAITAFCNPADQHRCRVAGFDAILTKPLKHGDVEIALKQFSFGIVNTPIKHTIDKDLNFDNLEVLDHTMIDQLRLSGSQSALENIQTKFWTDIESNSQLIKTVLPGALNAAPQALTSLRESVHSIKGLSASIGLYRAAHIARHLQNAPPNQIGMLLKALFETLYVSKAQLNAALLQSSCPKTSLGPPNLNQTHEAILQNGANAQIK
ncbi:MAG: response regulator [Litorimonas sp.]